MKGLIYLGLALLIFIYIALKGEYETLINAVIGITIGIIIMVIVEFGSFLLKRTK